MYLCLQMNQRLNGAAQNGDIDALYTLILEDPYILERIDAAPFVDTPLHIAAFAGQTQFALEMMRLKPSFAMKPNPNGFSPMHLALQNKHNNLVLSLVEVDPNLIRIKGRNGITLLHYVAEIGNLDLLAEFLSLCAASIEDLTNQSETALHIAVKNGGFGALEVLVGWLQKVQHKEAAYWMTNILNSKNTEGNTSLHIATSSNQTQLVRLLVNTKGIDVHAKNFEGLTTLDLSIHQRQSCNREIREILLRAGAKKASRFGSVLTHADYLRSRMPFYERWGLSIVCGKIYMSTDNRNALLVVAVLIATTTYQAGLTPPGGVWQDDFTPQHDLNTTTSLLPAPPHYAGKTILAAYAFDFFTFYNTAAFFVSMLIISVLLPCDFYGWMVSLPHGMLFFCHTWSVCVISGSVYTTAFIEIFLSLVLSFSIFLLRLFRRITRMKHVVLLGRNFPAEELG